MTAESPIPAIVLAAGESRRLGHPKQLVQHEGETLLARAIRTAHESGAAPIFVVLGANAQLIHHSIATSPATLVMNENWQEGIASSIRVGFYAAAESTPPCDAVLLMTCDQPRITPAHLAALLHAFRHQPEPSIAASAYAGVRGIPAIFPRAVFPQLQALKGDTGARRLLLHPPCALIEIPFEGGAIDIDEPHDLAQLDPRVPPVS